METPKQIPETFLVEQAYVIGILFFLELWPLVESRVIEEERLHGVYSLFFIDICSGDKCFGEAPHAEWNEAIRRTLHIPKEEQKKLRLSLPEIFSCIIEFCKIHNERYNFKIAYAVHLLESMKKDPKNCKEEWAIWQETIEEPLDKYMDDGFNWLDELPKQKIDAPKGDQLMTSLLPFQKINRAQ